MRAIESNTSKAGKKTFKVRYRYAGRQSSQTFDRHADAKRFAALLDALGPVGALEQMDREKALREVPTLDKVAADHIRYLTGIEDGTRLNYTRLWARTWGKLIGHVPATSLTKDMIRDATNTLAHDYSHKSLKNQRGLLAGVCDRCVDEGHLATNPTKRLPLPRSGEEAKQDMRILTPTEFATILEQTHHHYRPFVRFLAGTGARWGEAVALQVQDVALPNVRIRRGLKWSPDNNRVVGPTKTRRGNRTVALPSEVQADVERLLLAPCAIPEPCDPDCELGPKHCSNLHAPSHKHHAHPQRPGEALVFMAPRGGPIQHRTFWHDIWLPACNSITPRPRIHDLRHTHAAWLLAAGVPIHVVQARLGHESITTTVDTYGGLLPDAQVAAAAAADAVFASSGDAIRGKPAPPPLG